MSTYYLAVDIGASSGRHMLGRLKDGRILLEEIYRFPNGMVRADGHLCWDVEALFREIKEGLKRCKEMGKIPSFMGIDTWGVDYVLLDENDKILGKTYGYRDGRMNGMDIELFRRISQMVNVPVIACGGVSGAEDVMRAAEAGVSAVALGSLLHFHKASVEELKRDVL